MRLDRDPGIDRTVGEAVEWLLRAQDCSASADGGVARHYSVVDGWGHSYPEVTGYIVPTLLTYAEQRRDPALADRARTMLDWLLGLQSQEGAFHGGTVRDRPLRPVIFNTGQVLLGLAAGAARFGQPYRDAMHRAAIWLVGAQERDGRWAAHRSPFAEPGPKAYETHAAWGLLEAAKAAASHGDGRSASAYADAALRNVRWALEQQHNNGWFAHCCVNDSAQPLTHTLGYALRGVIEAYRHSADEALLVAAERCARGLAAALRPDGFLPGRFAPDWRGTVDWVCLTGSAQLAHCWLLLFEETGDELYLSAARTANRYVRCTVDVDGPPEVRGAVRGSFPISGGYGRFKYLSWAAKFLIDANLGERCLELQ